MSPLKSGRLDARDFIFPEVQMLQFRQLLEEAVRFDLVQLIVAQQSGANTQTEKDICRAKSRLYDRVEMLACFAVRMYR